MRYLLRSGALKENLVLKDIGSAGKEFTVTLSAPGLKADLYEDGGIEFSDEKGEGIFRLPPACLYDAADQMGAVKTELRPLENGEYLLALKPDEGWLKDPERKWPVVLDPTVESKKNYTNIDDTFVETSHKGTNRSSLNKMLVGYAGGYGKCRGFVKIKNLPKLKSSNMIVAAVLQVYVNGYSDNGKLQVNAHIVTKDTTVNYSSMTWNNQPSYDPRVLDYKMFTTAYRANQYYITPAVRSWYDGSVLNNGIAFVSPTEGTSANGYGSFYSSERVDTTAPQLVIFYTNTNGLEDCWDYSTQNVGRAGTAYVQNFTGNFLMSRTDMSYGGNRMPASVSFTYELSTQDLAIGYGNGWRCNYAQTLVSCSVNNTSYYRWTDGDGTEKYFKKVSGVWKDELGYGYTLTIGSGTGANAKYTVKDKKDNRLIFDAYGRLMTVRGANDNNLLQITYAVNASGNSRIATVTDGAGRVYRFTYSDNSTGVLTTLEYLGAGTTALETVEYSYAADGTLLEVTYQDGLDEIADPAGDGTTGKTAQYTWTGNAMDTASDIRKGDGTRDTLSVTYIEENTINPLRTASLQYTSYEEDNEHVMAPVTVGSLAFEYGENMTRVTDQNGHYAIYQFNNFGNTTSVYNERGQALYGRYAQDTDAANRANQLMAGSRLQSTSLANETISLNGDTMILYIRQNLLENPDFTNDLSCWTGVNTTTADGYETITPDPLDHDTRGGLDNGTAKLVGKAKTEKHYDQTLQIEGTAGDIFTFGGWIKADCADLNACTLAHKPAQYKRKAGIIVQLFYNEDPAGDAYVAMNPDSRYWQFLSGRVTATANYNRVVFSFVYYNNANTAWFDGAQLFHEPFDYVYTYDDDGNLETMTDPDGNVTNYEYVDDTSDVAKITLPGGSEFSFTYNDDHQLTKTLSPKDIVTETVYDDYGNSTDSYVYRDPGSINAANPTDFLVPGEANGEPVVRSWPMIHSSSTYTADHNMAAAVTSPEGSTLTYANDTDLSLISSITDAKNAVTSYSYDNMRRKILTTGPNGSTVTNEYTDDLLTGMSHSNGTGVSTDYVLEYGIANLPTAVKIGSTWSLVQNSYNANTWTLAQQLYGNGQAWNYVYDEDSDLLTQRYRVISADSLLRYCYEYDTRDRLIHVKKESVTHVPGGQDQVALISSEYYLYNGSDKLVRIIGADAANYLTSDVSWAYDNDDHMTGLHFERRESGQAVWAKDYSFTYDEEKKPTGSSFAYSETTEGGVTTTESLSEGLVYETLQRLSAKVVKKVTTTESGGQDPQTSEQEVLRTTYSYRDIDSVYTTNQIVGLTAHYGSTTTGHSYTYDANGNILSDSDGTHTTEYVYDSLNQLVWEKNEAAHKAWQYSYDLGGNILSKTEYDYSNGVTTNPQTVSYTYGDTVWHDLLTAWNNQPITYDGIGNPTSYRGWSMTWQGGRQLAGMTDGTDTLSFAYNEKGLRTEKTVNNVTRKYVWNGSRLMADIGPNDSFYFHYDSNGEMVGYTYKTAGGETQCVFVKNLQGDVEKVLNAETGAVLASYSYDAWGNILTATGDMASVNPTRYRGYYFDSETGSYYLKSRYYDPQIGRYINTDRFVGIGYDTNEVGLFCYGRNNPVLFLDSNGNSPWGELTIEDYYKIHRKVQKMSAKDGWLIEITVHWGDKGKGRLDIFNPQDDTYYEVKKQEYAEQEPGKTATRNQMENYDSSVIWNTLKNRIFIRANIGHTIERGNQCDIAGTFKYGMYDVEYKYSERGLITYSVSKNSEREKLAIALQLVVLLFFVGMKTPGIVPPGETLPLIT